MKAKHFISIFLVFTLLALIQYPRLAAQEVSLHAGINVLAGGNFNTNTGSSDITLVMKLEADGEALVDEGHKVKYIVPDSDIDGWLEPGFDDSTWEDGISGVGYGDTDDNTVVAGGIQSIYTRYRFDVPDPFAITELIFYVDYDDGYVAWLNGVEIWRSAGMQGRGEPPPWNASSGGHGSSEQAKGNPNPNRWGHGDIENKTIEFTPKLGSVAVESTGKLAITWGNMKAKH
jgi:hypothetical protein